MDECVPICSSSLRKRTVFVLSVHPICLGGLWLGVFSFVRVHNVIYIYTVSIKYDYLNTMHRQNRKNRYTPLKQFNLKTLSATISCCKCHVMTFLCPNVFMFWKIKSQISSLHILLSELMKISCSKVMCFYHGVIILWFLLSCLAQYYRGLSLLQNTYSLKCTAGIQQNT